MRPRITLIAAITGGLLWTLAGCAQLGLKTTETTLSGRDPKPANDQIEDAPTPKINARTFFAAGQVHEREGNFLAASQQYYRAVATDPNYVMAFNRLGVTYQQLKLYDRANAAFERAIALAPRAAFLRNNLGYSRMLQGDYGAAECALRESLAIQPDYKRAQANLAVVLTRTNRVNEAVELFAQAVSRDSAYYNVGVLCVADGRYAEARTAFNQALQVNPGLTAARTQLERLNGLAANPDDPASARYLAAARRVAGVFGPTPTTGGAGYVPDLEWSQPSAVAAAQLTPPTAAPVVNGGVTPAPIAPVAMQPAASGQYVDLTAGDVGVQSPPVAATASVEAPVQVEQPQQPTLTTVSQFMPEPQRGTQLAKPDYVQPAPPSVVAQTTSSVVVADDGVATMQPVSEITTPVAARPAPRAEFAPPQAPVAAVAQPTNAPAVTTQAAASTPRATEWRADGNAAATQQPVQWEWLTRADAGGSEPVAASATHSTPIEVQPASNDDAETAWGEMQDPADKPASYDTTAAVDAAHDMDEPGEMNNEAEWIAPEPPAQTAAIEQPSPRAAEPAVSAMAPVTHWESLTPTSPSVAATPASVPPAYVAPKPIAVTTAHVEPIARDCDPLPESPARNVAPTQSAGSMTLLTPPVQSAAAAAPITASATCDIVSVDTGESLQSADAPVAGAVGRDADAATIDARQFKRLAPLAPLMITLLAPPSGARPAVLTEQRARGDQSPVRRDRTPQTEPAAMTAVDASNPVAPQPVRPAPARPAETKLAGAAQSIDDDDVVDLTPRN